MSETSGEKIKEAVRASYGNIARRFVEGSEAGEPARASCCASSPAPQDSAACCSPGPSSERTQSGSCCESEPVILSRQGASCCGSSQTVDPLGSAACCSPGASPERTQSGSCCESEPVILSRQGTSCCGSGRAAGPVQSAACCGPSTAEVEISDGAARFYSAQELDGLPDTVTLASLGCGNPTAIAELRPGEVVLDLGSGGGIDCFLAARQVGPEGRVIGLDMTPDMIKLARRNARKVGAQNVDFRFGEMEDIPLPDGSVDVILSNCVINLSPDKDAVFGEAYRVLRPGGRLSVSDIVVDGDLPPAIRDSLNAWAGCVAGALDESVYLEKIRAAGFEDVAVASRDLADPEQVAEDAQVLVVGPDGQVIDGEQAKALLSASGVSAREVASKVASIRVQARKPA
ncbi:MAG: arsenite methyltransferase [Anaerolineae bacterium]|nr:arsenite methyltransferase [Anaerolineae bacterium]